MIHQIRGEVLGNEPGGVIIDIAGFGIFVHLAGSELLTPGEVVTLTTYLAVKQDGMDLYGFTSSADRRFFELLLTVSGVGPKTALSIFSKASRESLEGAIASRDISYLTRVVGLGKKAAEKLAVELADKLDAGVRTPDGDDGEVFDTLVALGYTEREARAALGTIPLHVQGRDARLKSVLSKK